MKSRIDVVGQNGNDGLHYELDKLNPEYSDEFWNWYKFFLQSPRMCSLQYDDEKMWEAWKAGQKSLGQMIKDNAELGKQK